jgi:hypothetical protein
MKWRLFMRNMSVSAPKVTVRSKMSWPLRGLLAFVFAAVAAAAGVAIYEFGRNFAGPDRKELQAELERVNSQLRETSLDRDRAAALATAYESQLKVERVTQEQLMQQVRTLEAETTRLQEDLSFFDSLLPAGKGDKGVVIRSFRVQPDDNPNQMHYRLLVQQNGKPDKDFVGSVELMVNFTQNAHNFTLQLPDPNAGAADERPMQLSFRHYQRIEGTFSLPAGALAHSVQVRIVAGGETQYQQTFNL